MCPPHLRGSGGSERFKREGGREGVGVSSISNETQRRWWMRRRRRRRRREEEEDEEEGGGSGRREEEEDGEYKIEVL